MSTKRLQVVADTGYSVRVTDRSLDIIIAQLREARELAAANGYFPDTLTLEHSEDYEFDSTMAVFGKRWETDKEYFKRVRGIEVAQKRAAAAKEKRRAQYEKLRKEFGEA